MAPGSLKAHVHPKCIARPVLQKKKTFRVVSSRNAPQKWKPIKTLHPWQKNRIVSKQKHKQAKPLGEHGPLNSGLAVVLENKSAYKKRLIF